MHRNKSGSNGIKPVPGLEGLRKKQNQSNCSAPWILPHPPNSDMYPSLPKFLHLRNGRGTETSQGTDSKTGLTEHQHHFKYRLSQLPSEKHGSSRKQPATKHSFLILLLPATPLLQKYFLLSGAIRRPLQQVFLTPPSHWAVPGTCHGTEHLPANTHLLKPGDKSHHRHLNYH